jgi:hypothetical protein
MSSLIFFSLSSAMFINAIPLDVVPDAQRHPRVVPVDCCHR